MRCGKGRAECVSGSRGHARTLAPRKTSAESAVVRIDRLYLILDLYVGGCGQEQKKWRRADCGLGGLSVRGWGARRAR